MKYLTGLTEKKYVRLVIIQTHDNPVYRFIFESVGWVVLMLKFLFLYAVTAILCSFEAGVD